MDIEYLDIHKNEWLTDALIRSGHGDKIPSNIILDKTLTGVGATHCELYAHRHSIIIEPNVPVIQCKLENEDLSFLGVYAGVRISSIRKYLTREDIPYKKILTTPESFYKVRNEARKLGIDIYGEEWFCMFDECEKITQDHDYRRSISQPISEFFMFKNKAMVSATPLTPSDPKFQEQQFRIIKVRPSFDYKKNLTLIATNNFTTVLRDTFARLAESPCVCVFMNKTDSIHAIVEEFGLDDYKIFCSDKSVKKLHDLGIHKAQSEISYPFAKYNFFTCRFYSGLDITLLPIKPDIIMLTDLRIAPYTMIDPLTEAIQIQGRFRNNGNDEQTYNTLTHIANVNPDMLIKSREELSVEIGQYADTYKRLKIQWQEEQDEIKKQAIQKDLKQLKYNDLLDEQGEISYFAIDNLYNEERVNSYYLSGNSLCLAYIESNHFNVNYINDVISLGSDTILHINTTKCEIDKRRLIVHAIDRIYNDLSNGNIDNDTANLYIEALKQIDETSYILPIYQKIGIKGIEDCEYKKGKLDKAIKIFEKEEEEQAEQLRFAPIVLKDVFDTFPLEVYIPKEEIKERLKIIYRKHCVKLKVTQATIKEYYDISESNSKVPPSFKLNFFKFDGRFLDAPP